MTWDCLWVNATLVTLEKNSFQLQPNAAIASEQGRIAWLGPQDECPGQAAKTIDCEHALLTPGLIDCHSHVIYAGNRADEFEARLQGDSYEAIAKRGGGILRTVEATRQASEDDLFASAAKRIQVMMAQGVTTLEIKSGYGLNLESELKMLRVARRLAAELPITIKTTCLAAHTVPPEYQQRSDEYTQYVCDTILPAVAQANLADFVDVFCESIAFTTAQTEAIFAKACDLGIAIKCHADQLSNIGASSVAAHYRAVSVDHCEYSTKADLKALKEAGTTVVLLPGAYYFLRESKAPPIQMIRDANLNMAIATDCNPGSSPTTSLLLMMNMAAVFWGLTPFEVFRGVTEHAAKALNLSSGKLAIGMPADFALWDVQHPRDLVYQFGHAPLIDRIYQGKSGDHHD